jgi:hypothetical protein
MLAALTITALYLFSGHQTWRLLCLSPRGEPLELDAIVASSNASASRAAMTVKGTFLLGWPLWMAIGFICAVAGASSDA